MTPNEAEYKLTRALKELNETKPIVNDLLNRVNELCKVTNELVEKVSKLELDVEILKDGGNI